MWGWLTLCIVVSLIGVTATRLFCALVFPSVGQDLHTTSKRKLDIPKDLVERSSLSFCCRELICDSEVRARRTFQASLPTRTNQLHVNPRDSISGFLHSRFTNNEQKKLNKCSATAGVWSTARSTSQQVTKVRTHAHMQSLACPRTCGRMPHVHDSPF